MKNFSYIYNSIKLIFSSKRYIFLFSVMSLIIGILYTYLLVSSATGIIDFGKYYLVFDIVSEIAISLLISIVITLNIYLIKRSIKGSSKLSLLSVISAILPSSLCCTSIVPSLISLVGFSTSFVVTTTGKIQSIFSYFGPLFIVVGILLAFVGLLSISKNLEYCRCEI